MKHTYPKIIGSILLLFSFSCTQQEGKGPLRVSDVNPRYFTDNSGKAVYLTGSHMWNNLVDMQRKGEEYELDYQGYIDFLNKHNHNFFRLWTWDILFWDVRRNRSKDTSILYVPLKPWARTGPGMAFDGKPKFDLNHFNAEYFERLRERVGLAQQNNIYVGVMFFEGYGTQFMKDGYKNHPIYPENNINNIDLPIGYDSLGLKIYQLASDCVFEFQKQYLKKVVETVNGFDNVLYEVSNETHPSSTEWQYAVINYVKELEESMPKQHPVGMTFQWHGGVDQTLFDSPADWISHGKVNGYKDNPPPSTGEKVIISDTDHIWGVGGYREWVWKTFLRGMNPIIMDAYDHMVLDKGRGAAWDYRMRMACGNSRIIADGMDLINTVPDTLISSSGYCLANKGIEYLVYLPNSLKYEVDLTSDAASFRATWINPINLDSLDGGLFNGREIKTVQSPFEDVPDALISLVSIDKY